MVLWCAKDVVIAGSQIKEAECSDWYVTLYVDVLLLDSMLDALALRY